ncbi:hypothetical protein DF186_23350, partial [Enterococcus hirae]
AGRGCRRRPRIAPRLSRAAPDRRGDLQAALEAAGAGRDGAQAGAGAAGVLRRDRRGPSGTGARGDDHEEHRPLRRRPEGP